MKDDETFIINLECESIGTHWKALYMSRDNVVYFDSFRVEHIRTNYNRSFRT